MGFLGRLIRPIVENAFNRMQSEATQNILKEQGEKLSKVQSLFPVQEIFSSGPMAQITATYSSGVNAARTEFQNLLGSQFAPLTRDINAFTGGVRNLFEDFFFENRAGGLIGQTIGNVGGFIAGFILPGGPLLWSQIFGFLGTFAGTFIQGGVLNPIHPNIPGTPGEIPPPPPPGSEQYGSGGLPDHAQDLVNQALASTPTPTLTPSQLQMAVYANKIGRHIF